MSRVSLSEWQKAVKYIEILCQIKYNFLYQQIRNIIYVYVSMYYVRMLMKKRQSNSKFWVLLSTIFYCQYTSLITNKNTYSEKIVYYLEIIGISSLHTKSSEISSKFPFFPQLWYIIPLFDAFISKILTDLEPFQCRRQKENPTLKKISPVYKMCTVAIAPIAYSLLHSSHMWCRAGRKAG